MNNKTEVAFQIIKHTLKHILKKLKRKYKTHVKKKKVIFDKYILLRCLLVVGNLF